jgi:HK97 family phage portal protein
MANAPKDMALTELHDLTESRICAVFGVPAILVGANVGLQRSTYSNYREARMAFHSETLEPMVSRILRHLNRNLFDDYPGNETLTVDWAEMRSGLDDREAMTSRVTGLFAGGILTLNEAREQLGSRPSPTARSGAYPRPSLKWPRVHRPRWRLAPLRWRSLCRSERSRNGKTSRP